MRKAYSLDAPIEIKGKVITIDTAIVIVKGKRAERLEILLH
jgi:hypothetical protein